MADISPFRAFRYDLGRVGALGEVVAPPYDVIDPALQDRLYAKSPYNVVRIDLGKGEPADNEQENRYTRASRTLKDWTSTGVLKQDTARGFYVYHQEYEVEGRRHVRRGFLARVRLEPFGAGQIYAHEETMPGPKEDRLKLMRATGMNLSPIFGLYPDQSAEVQGLLDDAIRRSPPLEATDHLGTVSRLWPVTDQRVLSQVTGLLGPKPVFIADGHHRYETALKYREERQAAGDVPNADAPANFTLMMLVGMSDPGLLILPTHRLISGLPAMTGERLRELLGDHFQVGTQGTGLTAGASCAELAEMDRQMLVFWTVADDSWHLASLRKAKKVMAQLAPDHGPAWRALAVSVLHVVVLDKLIPEKFGRQPISEYVHSMAEVMEAVERKRCQLAVLVPEVTMDEVETIAGGLEKMPPKSTYFYPKLLTGLVFNSLKAH